MSLRIKSSVIGCFVIIQVMTTSHLVYARTLPEAADAIETSSVPVTSAKEDLQTLESSLRTGYGYLKYYEKRWKFNFSALVGLKQAALDLMGASGQVRLYDFKALLSEATSAFRDGHTYMTLKGDDKFTLNIGLYYSPDVNQYLVYRGNAEIYSQLGVSVEQFQKQMYVLTAVNGVPIERVVAAFDPVLPYSNLLTRKTYAGIFLGSSKGLLYLSSLMKRGLFPTSDEVLKLDFKSRVTGEQVSTHVSPQVMSDWSIDDLLNKVEGRSASIVPKDNSPQAYADAYGWKFSEIEPGVFLFKIPSWAPDLINSKNTVPSRQALYQFVEQSMARLDAHPNAKLILDVRGNRGGDVILWRPIIQKLMKEKAAVTGVLQLNAEMQTTYPKYRGLPPEVSLALAEHKDYFDYSYYGDDPGLSPDAKNAIEKTEARLQASGKLHNGVIFQDPSFSKPLYEVIEKPDATYLNCDVTLLTDRFGFSANDTFREALRSILPPNKLVIYGEKTEGGSGTGGKIHLPKTDLSMSSGSFVSFNKDGKLFESDFLKPDHELNLPIDSFFERDKWYLQQTLRLIKSQSHTGAHSCRALF